MKRSGRSLRRAAVVGLAAALLVSLAPGEAVANHANRYRELQRKIADARARIREANRRERGLLAEIAESDARRAALERSLALIGDELGAATTRLSVMTARLDRVTALLALRTQQLELALADLEDQTALLNERATNIYIRGPVDYTSLVLGAQSFDDMVAGFQYAKSVLETDTDLVDVLRAAKDRTAATRSDVEATRDEVAEATHAQAVETKRIAAIRNRRAAATRAVVREIDYRKSLLRRVRSEKEAYLRALQSYIQESNSIAAFLRGAQRGQRAIQGRGGWLKWPVSGRITSGYGWRTHPIYKKRSFHTGIDIGAGSGSTIRASRYGEVLYTGYKGAYGLIALVDHGSAVATLYAHMSRVYVRPGDWVRTQAAIGAVGCTGWCTGPHVHFEVRVNGEPQNPMGWL